MRFQVRWLETKDGRDYHGSLEGTKEFDLNADQLERIIDAASEPVEADDLYFTEWIDHDSKDPDRKVAVVTLCPCNPNECFSDVDKVARELLQDLEARGGMAAPEMPLTYTDQLDPALQVDAEEAVAAYLYDCIGEMDEEDAAKHGREAVLLVISRIHPDWVTRAKPF